MNQSPSYRVPHIPEPERYGCLLSSALGCHALVLTGLLLYGMWLFITLFQVSFNHLMKLIDLGLIVLLWSAVVHLFDRFRWAWRLTIWVYGIALFFAVFLKQVHWLIAIVPLAMLLAAKSQFDR